jgi:diguanylate cyclase (GGDEF)-like protein
MTRPLLYIAGDLTPWNPEEAPVPPDATGDPPPGLERSVVSPSVADALVRTLIELARVGHRARDVREALELSAIVLEQTLGAAAGALETDLLGVRERFTWGPASDDPSIVVTTTIEPGATVSIVGSSLRVMALGAAEVIAEAVGDVVVAVLERRALEQRAFAGDATAFIATLFGRLSADELVRLETFLRALPGVAVVSIAAEGEPAPPELDDGWAVSAHLDDDHVVHVGLAQDESTHEDAAVTTRRVLAILAALRARDQELRWLRGAIDTDPLTGVDSRRRVVRVLSETLALAKRTEADVAAIVFDIDRFADVNRLHGQHGGDAALRAFAALLGRETRGYDRIVRIGGDEFLLVLPSTDAAGAKAMAERLRQTAPAVLPTGLDGAATTVSAGVAVYPLGAADGGALVEAADRGLYAAKTAGRNRVVLAYGEPPHQS